MPLLIVPPRLAGSDYRPGTLCRRPVGLIDLYPTLIDLCGLPTRHDLDGHSLRPLLKDPAGETRPVVTTFGYGNYSVRSNRWRLIHYDDGSEELYDHRSDPHEWNNLAGDAHYAQVQRDLAERLPTSAAKPPNR